MYKSPLEEMPVMLATAIRRGSTEVPTVVAERMERLPVPPMVMSAVVAPGDVTAPPVFIVKVWLLGKVKVFPPAKFNTTLDEAPRRVKLYDSAPALIDPEPPIVMVPVPGALPMVTVLEESIRVVNSVASRLNPAPALLR
jgi:hypothetical protein